MTVLLYSAIQLVILKTYLHLILAAIKGGDIAKVIAAGLPNVSGYLGATHPYADDRTGPFRQIAYGGGFSGDGSNPQLGKVEMDLSLGNKIYGASTTVQSPAITAIPQVKI